MGIATILIVYEDYTQHRRRSPRARPPADADRRKDGARARGPGSPHRPRERAPPGGAGRHGACPAVRSAPAQQPSSGRVILVDTSVWVDRLRRDNPALRRLLDDATVAGHSFVIGELACDTLRNRD